MVLIALDVMLLIERKTVLGRSRSSDDDEVIGGIYTYAFVTHTHTHIALTRERSTAS